MVKLVYRIGARKIGKFDPHFMLMLLWITTNRGEPFVVLTHLFCPDFNHVLRNGVRPTQRV